MRTVALALAAIGSLPSSARAQDTAQRQLLDPFRVETEAAPALLESDALTLIDVMRPNLGEDRFFIETSTMRKTGSIAEAWTFGAYVETQNVSSDNARDGVWVSMRFDCAANTYQRLAGALTNANGLTHHRINFQEAARPIAQDTMLYYAAHIACGVWDWRKSGPGLPSATAAIADVRLPVPPDYKPLPRLAPAPKH